MPSPKKSKTTAKKKLSEPKKGRGAAAAKSPAPASSARRKAPASGARPSVERALPDVEALRARLAALAGDLERQNEIAEAAEMERSALEDELGEARERIHELERELGATGRAEAPSGAPGATEVPFPEEEEEEPLPGGGDLEDDVDHLYERMDDVRVHRRELDRERIDREDEAGHEPFWMVCPKCGESIEEIESVEIKLDRCEGCGGVYLDRGELELLLMISKGPDALRRLRSILQI